MRQVKTSAIHIIPQSVVCCTIAKYIIAILTLTSFVSCSLSIREQERLIREMILNPQSIGEICIANQIMMGDELKEAIMCNQEVYIRHFEQFEQRYRLDKWLDAKDDYGKLYRSIYITDMDSKNRTEFQFWRTEDGWILHNIVFVHDVITGPPRELEELIEGIILNPSNIMEIFHGGKIELREGLKRIINANTEVYVNHFERFKGKYIRREIFREEAVDGHEVARSIFITDAVDRNLTEFQFLRNGQGWVLRNLWIGRDDITDSSQNRGP